MATALYAKVEATISSFIGAEKASGVFSRQLKFCAPATADSFGADDMKKIITYLTTAAGLYVSDAAKKEELVAKLKSMAG